jgi:hypothetical protein
VKQRRAAEAAARDDEDRERRAAGKNCVKRNKEEEERKAKEEDDAAAADPAAALAAVADPLAEAAKPLQLLQLHACARLQTHQVRSEREREREALGGGRRAERGDEHAHAPQPNTRGAGRLIHEARLRPRQRVEPECASSAARRIGLTRSWDGGGGHTQLAFEVYLRQGAVLLALRAVRRMRTLAPLHPATHAATVRLLHYVLAQKTAAAAGDGAAAARVPAVVAAVVDAEAAAMGAPKATLADLLACNQVRPVGGHGFHRSGCR